MSEKLLRCPFCGGEAELKQFYPYMQRRIHTVIRCTKCRANSGEWRMKNKAIEAWNTRKPMQNIVERLEERMKMHDEAKKECCEKNNMDLFDKHYHRAGAFSCAIEIVKEEGGVE